MQEGLLIVALLASSCAAGAQALSPAAAARSRFDAFEVATIKLTGTDQQGRFIKMQSANRFIERAYTLKLLIAAAYDLNPRTISGGPALIDSDRYDIEAVTPGDLRPTHDEQMIMLRSLLTERFKLKFHREQKDFAVYALEQLKSGAKLKATASPTEPPVMGPGVVYPQRIVLPARNATLGELASLLQRAIVDRPVIDQTGLPGRYDFNLEWAPDETQFGGDVPSATGAATSLPLFTAIQQQLGLRLQPTHLAIAALVVDSSQKPSEN